jgi:ABC-type transporter Mla subunit MlaD
MDALVHDKALDESIQRLNRSLADVEQVTKAARENVGPMTKSIRNTAEMAEQATKKVSENIDPIVKSLRNAAASAETAASRATQLVGSGPRQNYDLGSLIEELTKAALAVRTLSNYLEENPDALLKGRGK